MVQDSLSRLATANVSIKVEGSDSYVYFSILSFVHGSVDADIATVELSSSVRDIYLNTSFVPHISYETIKKLDADARSVYLYIKHNNTKVNMTIRHKIFKDGTFLPEVATKDI